MNTRQQRHEFTQDDKSAKVYITNEGYEVDFYKGMTLLKTECLHTHSEQYAEDAAENFVTGVMQLNG
jgi:hypothetical protein